MSYIKYKVGDRVRIKSIDWYNDNKDEYGIVICGMPFCDYMSFLCGKIVTISEILEFGYCIKEDDGQYRWTDEMIEGLVKNDIIDIDEFQDDNEIIDIIHEYVHRLEDNECQIILPEGYQFTDEDGNVINATKIVLEKKNDKKVNFLRELSELLNKYSIDSKMNLPDYALAEYIWKTLFVNE